MHPKKVLATSRRVLAQLKHDPRTIGLVLFMPSVLLVILRYVYQGNQALYNSFAPILLVILAFAVMTVVTSVATLRERSTGTLERLLTLPISKLDILLGYALAFAVLTLLQSGLATALVFGVFDVAVAGSVWQVLLVSTLSGLTGMNFGLFLSDFATSEFQAVQIMPAFVLPQLLTCGLFIPREEMLEALQWLANVLPLTYMVEAINAVVATAGWGQELVVDLAIITGFMLAALLLGALSLNSE